jgi:hypothetical protein
MDLLISAPMALAPRRVFPHWSIAIPPWFDETFVEEDCYWHAWDLTRSVSLTSMVFVDKRGRAPTVDELLAEHSPMPGQAIEERPPDLPGIAGYGPVPQPARASSALCGILAVEGRLLLATITSDDLDWALDVWRSIRHHADGPPTETRPWKPRRERRSKRR